MARATLLAETVYGRIKEEIADFHLLPGDRFTETEMAERYMVSRTPVRDALYRLKHEGYVDVAFRAGWSILPWDFARFDALYELRTVLECAAVERLCQGAAEIAFPRLEAVWLASPAGRETDPRRIAEHDEDFHAELVAAAGDRETAAVHLQVAEKIRIIRRLDFLHSERVRATYDEHAQILRLVLRRRGSEAAMLMRAHIEESRMEVRKITLHMLYEARAAAPATMATTAA